MDYWVINILSRNLKILNLEEYIDNGKELTIAFFDNSDQLKISPGDIVFVLDGRLSNKLFFRNLSELIKIDKSFKIDDSEGFQIFESYLSFKEYSISLTPSKTFVHIFNLRIDEEYKDSRLLDDFSFTLTGIRDFNRPYSSFTSIKKIQKIDYQSIRYNKFFLSRTCFGHIVNALPLETRWDIVTSLMSHFNTDKPFGIDFKEALEFVKTYIDQRILSVGSYLIETSSILKENFSNLGIENKIGFKENLSDYREDRIKVQSAYFELLEKVTNQYSFWNKVFDEIEIFSTEEKKYSTAFKNVRWPINLNIRS